MTEENVIEVNGGTFIGFDEEKFLRRLAECYIEDLGERTGERYVLTGLKLRKKGITSDGKIERWRARWKDRKMERWRARWKDRKMERWRARWKDGELDGKIERWKDGK